MPKGSDEFKKNQPLISVIVPIYKVESFLHKCIESILGQTYKNYELILVDDGSPDGCGAICDQYADTYTNITVIHQNNQGLSMARNNAVSISKGKYITFIDSDDFVTPDYLDYLMSLIEEFDAQISVGGRVYQYNNRSLSEPRKETRRGFNTKEEALVKMNYGIDFSVNAWGKLYKKELIENNPYPAGKLYEDLATTYKIISSSTGIAYGNKDIYYWIQRPGSIMHSTFNENQLDGLEAARNQLRFFEKNYPMALDAAKYRYVAKTIELIGICFLSGGDKKVFHFLKKKMNIYYKEVIANKKTKTSIKIRMRAVNTGYLPSKIVFLIHEKMKEWIMN